MSTKLMGHHPLIVVDEPYERRLDEAIVHQAEALSDGVAKTPLETMGEMGLWLGRGAIRVGVLAVAALNGGVHLNVN